MRMQGSYDIAQARQRQDEIVVERYEGAEAEVADGAAVKGTINRTWYG